MNDAELSRHYWLKKEIEAIKKELVNLNKDYITLENQERISALNESLNDKMNTAAEEIQRIEKFLDSVENAEMRLILRLRFVLLMTWEAIGNEVFMSPSGALRKCMKFLRAYNN